MFGALSCRGAAIVAGLALALSSPVRAGGPVIASTSGADLTTQIEGLETGEQLLVSNHSGTVRFAGEDVVLDDVSGMFGYSSGAAYLLIFDGDAAIGREQAKSGRMILIAPFGEGVVTERFDAERLRQSLLGEQVDGWDMAPLDRLSGAQKTGIFFGRLAPTNFNIGTMNSAEDELVQRDQVGAPALRDIRFSKTAEAGDPQVEERIVSQFIQALASRDAEAAARFLDPLPYGLSNLGDGGNDARLLMAQGLVDRTDWTSLAQASPTSDGVVPIWKFQTTNTSAWITLRRTTDFAFVQSVQLGE